MKKSYQHIIKKSYTTPKIEEVEIDVAISLDQPTGDPGSDNPGWDDGGEEGEGAETTNINQVSGYQPANYKTTDSPFGDRPAY